jgi:DNA polymerase elongation subunit (family B)
VYRNAYYSPKEGTVFLRTWSDDGDRIDTEIPFTPFLYTERENASDAISIFKTPLKKHYFKNSFDRNKFVTESNTKRLFGNFPVDQQFLIEKYKNQIHEKDFSKFPLKVYFLDIEVHCPDFFPEPKEAKAPVNLITIYDTLKDHIYTWGLNEDYYPKEKNITYFKCKCEEDLFVSFVNHWKQDPPDIVSGWNSERFDMPYIINRATNIISRDFINQLSPVKNLHFREFRDRFGQMAGKWTISGVSSIDYMELYKVYSFGDRESYSLNYIAEYELKEGKLAYNATNLANLANENWDQFVEYNIQDVDLLRKLENKLNFLKVVRMLSYKGCTNFEAALGKIGILSGAVAIQAFKEGQIIPTFKNDNETESLEGGYVREPERGLKEAVVSFDVNSLYPNTIITLNISPETKLGKIITGDWKKDKEIEIKLVNGKINKIEVEKFKKFIVDEKISVSKAGVLYTQKFKGVLPTLINRVYGERVESKKAMNSAKKSLSKVEKELSKNKTNELEKQKKDLEAEVIYYDVLQSVLKLTLNSIYGIMANKYSPLVDIDNASSITLTGQNVVKQGSVIVDKYAKERFGIEESLQIAGDTDSLYITINSILKKKGIALHENKQITQECHEIVNDIGTHLNQEILNWARTDLNSIDPRFEFKREAIADVGTFLQKKRYILHILDSEGIPCNKFKYVGVEVARSTTPKEVKEFIKKTIETAFLTKDIKKSNDVFREAYEKFKSLDVKEAAFRKSVKDYDKYSSKASLNKFEKGTPCHVKAAIAHNLLLQEHKILSKYETIKSGQKIKYFYASKNPYNLDAIAFINEYPKEFSNIKIDYDKMFDKIVVPPIENVYEAIGWRLPKMGKEVQTDLFDLFGE